MKNIKITSIDELIVFLNKLPNNYIYRGHSDESWTLQSTLERILGDTYESTSEKFEKYSLDDFKNKFHLYSNSSNLPESKLEWLSIMQHYGVPTRMLDFTRSPYIALYFALENAAKIGSSSFVIYAIDFRQTLKKSLSILKEYDKSVHVAYEEMFYKREELFEKIDNKSYEILWVVEPSISNLRLDRQAGCFLVSGNIKKTIEWLLTDTIYHEVDNYRLVIPGCFWDNIFTLLQKMNIDSRTIYGDLEGLSKSIKLFMRAYS